MGPLFDKVPEIYGTFHIIVLAICLVFFIALFLLAKKSNDKENLKNFHLKNTLLFLAYSQKYTKLLDSLLNDSSL